MVAFRTHCKCYKRGELIFFPRCLQRLFTCSDQSFDSGGNAVTFYWSRRVKFVHVSFHFFDPALISGQHLFAKIKNDAQHLLETWVLRMFADHRNILYSFFISLDCTQMFMAWLCISAYWPLTSDPTADDLKPPPYSEVAQSDAMDTSRPSHHALLPPPLSEGGDSASIISEAPPPYTPQPQPAWGPCQLQPIILGGPTQLDQSRTLMPTDSLPPFQVLSSSLPSHLGDPWQLCSLTKPRGQTVVLVF